MAKKRKLSRKARAAALRNLAKARRARKGGSKKRRRKAVVHRTHKRRSSVKRRRSTTKAVTKRRRRSISFTRLGGRIYRKNPGGGIVRQAVGLVKEGVVGAIGVKVGKAANVMAHNAIAKQLPTVGTGVAALGTSAALGVVVGYAARRFVPKYAAPIIYGAFTPLVDALLVKYAPPQVLSALSGDLDGALNAYPQGIAAYPTLAAYPALSGMADIGAGGSAHLDIGDVAGAEFGFASMGM